MGGLQNSASLQKAYSESAKSLTESAKGLSGMSNNVADIKSSLGDIARKGTVNIQSVHVM